MYSPESRWEFGGEGSLSESGTGGNGYFATGPWGGGIEDEHGEHIVAWQPARVLAKLEADRFVIDTLRQHEPADEWDTQPDIGQRANNCAGALRRLALPYANRPGYQEEWLPSGMTLPA